MRPTWSAGHSQYVEGADRPSLHYLGRAIDIEAVDGEAVSASSAPARAFAIAISGLTSERPTEVGTPWADLKTLPGFFSDANLTTHIHTGWAP
jgi:hypothetical protein